MIWFLVGHGLLLVVQGLLMVFSPAIMFHAASLEVVSLLKALGFATLSMGFLSFAMFKFRTNDHVFKVGLTTLMMFHIGSFLSTGPIAFQLNGPKQMPILSLVCLACLFLVQLSRKN